MGQERWVPLLEEQVAGDPLVQFRGWFDEAAAEVREPEAICVATVDAAGQPHARMVLLRGIEERGLVFYTNYLGGKGRELSERPRAAILWYCEPLGRQVRVEGPVEQVTPAESDGYFAARPRGHQVGAHASDQSRPIGSRPELEAKVAEAEARFASGAVPRPAHWGGFRLLPERWEFWQHRSDRLHDRIVFTREGEAWFRQRLQP